MNLDLFRRSFHEKVLSQVGKLERISNIEGTNSPLIQHTINLAVSCLKETGEAYFEVGCLNGSSLDSARRNNEDVIKYACDATIFGPMHGIIKDTPNLTFHQGNYFELGLGDFLKHPVGVYYYDADHDRQPTKQSNVRSNCKSRPGVMPILAERYILF